MNNNLEAGEFNIELKEEEPVWMDKKSKGEYLHTDLEGRKGVVYRYCRNKLGRFI